MRRFIWILLAMAFLLTALITFLLLQSRFYTAMNQIRQRLILIATNAAISIDAAQLQKIPLVQSSESTPDYMAVYNILVKIKEANPAVVKYAYIMTTTDQPYILQYVADADPTPQIITAKCPTSLPGDKYNASQSPEILRAFDQPTAEKKIITDLWGTFISGYAPIRGLDGRAVAILGVDSDAVELQNMQKELKPAGKILLIAGLVFFLSLFTLIKI